MSPYGKKAPLRVCPTSAKSLSNGSATKLRPASVADHWRVAVLWTNSPANPVVWLRMLSRSCTPLQVIARDRDAGTEDPPEREFTTLPKSLRGRLVTVNEASPAPGLIRTLSGSIAVVQKRPLVPAGPGLKSWI